MKREAAGQDTTNSCPICNATAKREEKLMDALHTARYVLTGTDGVKNDHMRVLRAKAAIDEALRLMGSGLQ